MSKAPLGQMIIELGLDSTDFGKGLTSARREVRTWSNEMSASMRAADFAGDKVGKLQARHEGLTKIITAQQKQVDSLKRSYDNSFVDGKPTAQTEKLASQLKQAEANLITYQKELRTAAGELAKMKVQTEGWTGALRTGGEGLQRFGKYATTLGDTLTKRVSLPLMAGVTLATKAASDWESSFAGVMKTNDEVIDSNGNIVYSYKDLEDGLREMAKELPATHSEIAEVAEAAGQLGIEAESVTSFTRTMIDMGESTNLSAESAASSLARLANITGMSQNDFDRLGSAIVGLGNNFATTEAEITDMALRLAGTGNQIGMTEADILGLAAAMSSVGINAEAGGTAMSTVLKKMQNAVADGSDDLIGFAKVARMSASEFADAFEKDPARALQAFVEGLEESSNEGDNLNSILGDLGITGIREADTLLRLAGNSELLGNALDMSATAWDENTALAEEAGLRYETLESQLGMLRNEAVDVAIDFGGPFVEALREGLDAAKPLIGAVSDLAQSFADADPKTQQAIIKMVGFGIAAGPVIGTVGRLATGIGGATVKTVDFLAEMAKKKAIDDFGGAAVTASGVKGIGAMSGALSTLNPWLIGLVGAGGLLAVGYGAWKLWGEEAYNASEQTRKWGTVVGEETNDVLTDVQGLGSQITGEFGLIAQGFDTDSSIIAGNFTEIGETIENSVIARINALDSIIEGLPETVSRTLSEIHEQEKDQSEKSLKTIEQNNEEIARIRQGAADNNRKESQIELERINQMSRESIEAYVSQLPIAQSEQKQILDAMNGDVENATYEQAKSWARSLGEQRQQMIKHNEEQKREYLSSLEELGYSDEYVAQAGKMWDDLTENTTLGLEQQLATIAEKYPQIAEEILFSNGQIISGNEIFVESAKKSNEELIENAQSLSYRMGVAASLAAKQLSWMGDETTKAGQRWNDLVFDEKTGEVKTNAREVVIEAAKEIDVWNGTIRPQLKNADLDSNAKLIIGEAAIQNGYWDSMAWEDKQAVLQDNFSETVYQAIVDEGTWDKLSWEEQIAVLNNEFSDGVAQAIIDEGKWASLPWEQKKAVLTTNSPETLRQVLRDIGVWETLPIAVRRLLADKTPLDRTVDAAQEKLNSLKDKEVTLRVRNETIYESIYRTKGNPTSANFVQSGGRILHNEKGTNYHPGGLAMVNDQRGAMFRELVQYPTGEQFIPHGRNVILDMPRGAKVLRASLTKQRFPDIPQYATGVGNIPVDSTVVQSIRNTRSTISEGNSKNIQIETLLREVIRRLDEIKNKKNITEINQTNHIEGVKPTERELAKQERIALEQFAYKLGLT